MARETADYRDNLAAILDYTGGAQMLTIGDVKEFCFGKDQAKHVDNRRVKRLFPIKDGYISAPTLARCMSSLRG